MKWDSNRATHSLKGKKKGTRIAEDPGLFFYSFSSLLLLNS
jgi:hypothetical protein